MSDESQDDIIIDTNIAQNNVIEEFNPDDEIAKAYDEDLDEGEDEGF